MQKFFGVVCVLVASFSLLVACGDDEGKSSAKPIELSELSQETAEAYCARAFNCCNQQELEEEFGADITRETCITTMKAQLDFQDMQNSVAAGRMTYNADKAGACLSAMEAVDCSEGVELGGENEPAACTQTFVAQVDLGGACKMSDECKSDWCQGIERDDQGNITQDGTCSEIPAIGEACEYVCEEGAYCDSTYDPETDAFTGECKAIVAAGETCDSSEACAEGHYCDMAAGESTGSCVEKKPAGQSCESYDECKSYTCEPSEGETESTCQGDDDSQMCTGN